MESESNETGGQDPYEFAIDVRLSFLESYAHDLVPDPTSGVSSERRAELKKEKEEMDIRIDELKKLKREMREN